jgi:RNA polymerase sigma-70 factor (ECF subfamily)
VLGVAGNIDELLTHATWVRALARHLCTDDADDLVQETWVAALQRPRGVIERPRPWLAEVLRNARRARHRRDLRRSEREARYEQEPPTAADDVLGEFQVARQLAEEVARLDEPYRETLLLHYYRGLGSAEIAARKGIAAGTVRWRLKEAVDRLRLRLDRSHGDRATWRRAITPLASAPLVPRGSLASTGKGALMGKIVFVALCTAGVGAGLYVHHADNASARAAATSSSAAPNENGTIHNDAASASVASVKKRDLAELRRIRDAFAASIAAAQRAARTSTGTPTGTLSADYISDAMQQLMPRFKWCYEDRLRTQPSLAGKLVVKFTISGDPELGGVVAASEVDDAQSTISDTQMRSCIESVVDDARFSPPEDDGDVEVEFPFEFTPAVAPPRP